MKLIIDIPEERLNSIKRFGIKQNEVSMTERALISGTPFDSVIEDIKTEIQMVMDMYEGCEYIGDKARRDELWHVLEIIDNHISGKENNENPNL